MSFQKALALYKTLEKYPFGKNVFSWLFCTQAPYFLTIKPVVNAVTAGHADVSMKQRWQVQNHIKTVHAIAVCNLVELSMGLLAEATIPNNLRWLPMGMDVNYLKKATGKLTAKSTVDPESFFTLDKYPGQVKVPVDVTNEDGVLVTTAEVRLWISEKPPQK